MEHNNEDTILSDAKLMSGNEFIAILDQHKKIVGKIRKSSVIAIFKGNDNRNTTDFTLSNGGIVNINAPVENFLLFMN